MATIDREEPMECSPSTASAEDQKAVEVTLSIQWLNPLEKNKKFFLETVFQSWVSTNKSTSMELTCHVVSKSKDSTEVVVSINPPPDSSLLEMLRGQTLGKNGKNVLTVMSARWDGCDVVMNATPPPLPSEACQERREEVEGASALPPGAPSTAEDGCLEIPLNQFQAMCSTYHKELASIEERNNCRLEVKAKLMFVKVTEEGDTRTALSDVQTLLQRYEGQPHGSVIFSCHDPEELMDAPTRISEPGKDFQVARSSLEQHGPSQSKNVAKPFGGIEGFVDDPKTSSWTPLQTPGDIKLDIDDPFGGGITIEAISWGLMKEYYTEQFITIESKFGVDFQAELSQDKVRVKVVGGRNEAMQSNALRALCHLYKKIVISPFNTNQPSGAGPSKHRSDPPGYHSDPPKHRSDPPKHRSDPPKHRSDPPGYHSDPPGYHSDPPKHRSDPPKHRSDPPKHRSDPPGYHSDPPKHSKTDYYNPPLNGSRDSAVKDVPAAQAATGGDGKEEHTCPICYDDFADKQQLDCKHEFCHGCLIKSIETIGPICPICQNVFGTMVGNQPVGRMTTTIIHTSLPGFSNCNTIVITYDIPDGIQTEKHPNPGARYQGTHRDAYLPNNEEGKQVLELLKKAFNQQLIFTIGESRMTGRKNQVTWNDIHHKTSIHGSNYGYPDESYLKRVRAELKAKGIE